MGKANKYFAPQPAIKQKQNKLTDADLLKVGDPGGAGGVGVVRHGGAGHRGAALSAASLISEQHRETARPRVAALRQALVGDPDVVPGGELGHRPSVVRHVHHLLVGGGQAVQGAVAKVAGRCVTRKRILGIHINIRKLLLTQHIVKDVWVLVPVREAKVFGTELIGWPALSPTFLLSVEGSCAELKGVT